MKKLHFIKILVCSMALCTVFSLCGCGDSDSNESSSQTKAPTTVSAFSNESSSQTKTSTTEKSSDTSTKISGDYEYEETDNGEITITKYIGSDTEISIPSEIDGKTVTSIGVRAFYKCRSIKSITIPDGVISVKSGAFEECENLANITVPDSVTDMGSYVFHKTIWYESQPYGIVYAGKIAYKYKGDILSNAQIVIKDGTKGIAEYAFYNQTKLSSLTIPDSVTNIGAKVFNNWKPSQTIYIKGRSEAPSGWNSEWNKDCDAQIAWNSEPDNINIIDEYKDLDYIPGTIVASGDLGKNGDNVKWELDESGLFIVSGSGEMVDCQNPNESHPLYEVWDKIKVVVIKSGVTTIGDLAFVNCHELNSIKISDTVTSIGHHSLMVGGHPESIIIPSGVTNIGSYAFAGWTSSQTIYMKGRSEAPSGWDSDWEKSCKAKIVWNA